MPGIRAYPQASSLLATDAFVIDRLGAGTMFIEGEALDGTPSLIASEAIAAGALVNVWSNGGAFAVRNASSSSSTTPADGYCLQAVTQGNAAIIAFSGIITGLVGLTPGRLWLGVTGGVSATAPTTPGQIAQAVGQAISATSMNFAPGPAVLL